VDDESIEKKAAKIAEKTIRERTNLHDDFYEYKGYRIIS